MNKMLSLVWFLSTHKVPIPCNLCNWNVEANAINPQFIKPIRFWPMSCGYWVRSLLAHKLQPPCHSFPFFFWKKWSFLFLYNTNTHFIQRGYSSLLQMHSPSVGKKTYSGIELEVEQIYEIAGFNVRIKFCNLKTKPAVSSIIFSLILHVPWHDLQRGWFEMNAWY